MRLHLSKIYLGGFVFLILGGIALKRIWGHPEFMMLFHLPAAVFLVLGGLEVKKNHQSSYEEEIRRVRERTPGSYDQG